MTCEFLPPANEVRGKVIFLHLSVILFGGGGGIPAHIAGGIPACLAVGGGIPACIAGGIPACLAAGGLLLGRVPGGDPHPDGYCCGRYASYWNAFLCAMYVLNKISVIPFSILNPENNVENYSYSEIVLCCCKFHEYICFIRLIQTGP